MITTIYIILGLVLLFALFVTFFLLRKKWQYKREFFKEHATPKGQHWLDGMIESVEVEDPNA